MSAWDLPRPAVLRDITPGCKVRFAYTFKDGETAVITGRAYGLSGKDGQVTMLRVELDEALPLKHQPAVKKALQADLRHPVAALNAARIIPDPRTGSITAPTPEPQPGDDGVFLMFEVTDDPAAADGRYGTARPDGWYTLHTADISPHEGGSQWLLQRDIWGRCDPEATARAWAAHMFELPAPDCGRWRVRWGGNLTTGEGAREITGEFGKAGA